MGGVAARVAAVLLAWCASCGLTNVDGSELHGGVLRANGVAHRGQRQEYYYYEGMPVNFTCTRTPQGPGSVQIAYFSKESNAVSTLFQSQYSVDMYFKLTAANNDTFLTCTIKDDSKNDSNINQIIQVRLLLRNVLYKEGFEVNGMLVARRADCSMHGGTLCFEYHYLWEERMTLRLVRDAREYGAVRCSVAGEFPPGPWLDHVNATETLSSSIGVHLVNTSLMMQQSGTRISCDLRRTASDHNGRLILEIRFIYYELVPFIGGLSMANVMLLYKDPNITYITYDNDMSYTGNGSHYLTCNPDGPDITAMWIFAPSELEISVETSPKSFRMKDGYKWSLIKCLRRKNNDPSVPERMVHLWLYRRDKASSPSTLKQLASPATNLPVRDKDAKSESWLPEVVAAAALAAFVCVVLAISVAWWRRRWWCAPGTASGDCTEQHAPTSTRSSCDSEENHYEVIPELPYCASKVPASIAQRPPQPLPASALEESDGGRYRHYDTPYEWRIFRFGVRRCACGRCSKSG